MIPGITLIVMVKNDANRLKRCLNSAINAVDKIIVLDTGSTDESISVAKSFNAELFEMPWPGAFDVALNHLIEKVETEWILRLDSDEWLEPNQESSFRELTNDETAFAYLMTRKDELENNQISEMTLIRFWRNHPKMRYVGTVHENFPPNILSEIANGRFVAESHIVFNHDGYKQGISHEKRQRNWDLLHKELKIRPGNIYFEILLAEESCIRNPKTGWDAVKKLAKKAAANESDLSPEDAWSILFSRYFSLLPDSELQSELTDAVVLRSWRWFGKFPAVVWAISILHLRRNNKWEAYNAMSQLDYLSQSGDYSKYSHFDPAFLSHGLWQNLAQAAHVIGKLDIALNNYKKLLVVYPNNPKIIQNIINIEHLQKN